MNKRLQRSPDTAMIGGVCSGIAEYFNVDPTWLRLLAVLLIFAGGFSLVAYIVAWIVIPRGPLVRSADNSAPAEPATHPARTDTGSGSGWALFPGAVLILVGLAFLFDNLFWWFDWDYVWPLLLVGTGVLMIFHSLKPSPGPSHETSAELVEVQNGSR